MAVIEELDMHVLVVWRVIQLPCVNTEVISMVLNTLITSDIVRFATALNPEKPSSV